MDTQPHRAVITRAADRPREGWDDPQRGSVFWHTLFSSDITPTNEMCAGVAEIPPGGGALALHRHDQAEIYFILDGTGILTIDGVETTVRAGDAVFIPGNAAHGLRNETAFVVRLFYVFPTGRFADVIYCWPG